MQNPVDKAILKEKLLAEKSRLESGLSSLGRKNPNVPGDWEALPPDTESDPDQNVEADVMEGFEEAVATQGELEQRLDEVLKAILRIEGDTYGICRECKNPIEPERLSANPAAETCITHRNL